MLYRQLFEETSSTYTYLLGCERAGAAVLVDPVLDMIERDLALNTLGLELAYTLDTHVHADYLTGCVQGQGSGRKPDRGTDETLVHPCHDYNDRFVSTIAQEKRRNPRTGLDKSRRTTRVSGGR